MERWGRITYRAALELVSACDCKDANAAKVIAAIACNLEPSEYYDEMPVARFTDAQIAEYIGCNKTTVRRALTRIFERDGLVKVRNGVKGHPSVYTFPCYIEEYSDTHTHGGTCPNKKESGDKADTLSQDADTLSQDADTPSNGEAWPPTESYQNTDRQYRKSKKKRLVFPCSFDDFAAFVDIHTRGKGNATTTRMYWQLEEQDFRHIDGSEIRNPYKYIRKAYQNQNVTWYDDEPDADSQRDGTCSEIPSQTVIACPQCHELTDARHLGGGMFNVNCPCGFSSCLSWGLVQKLKAGSKDV